MPGSISSQGLPFPSLTLQEAEGIPYLTDDALAHCCGVRIAFTGRAGGVSEGAYASLNLGMHVGDDANAVVQNRIRLLSALGAADIPVVVPSQVHGDTCVSVQSAHSETLKEAQSIAAEGADAIIVDVPEVAALLCFADCVSLIAVAPNGAFAVIHAGWRGVMARIAEKAIKELMRQSSCAACEVNVYIGPHIGPECFETSPEVHCAFIDSFGMQVAHDDTHIDLSAALKVTLKEAGVRADRIGESGICTLCEPQTYFSYRASGGQCGRHGALAFRRSM